MIAIVGASAAGLAAAEALRRQGYDGELMLIGEEPHAPYDRPPLSKQLLSGDWDRERLMLRTGEDLAGLGLDLRLGVRATALDAAARTLTLTPVEGGASETVGFDGLIIATGVRPRTLPGAPARVLRDLDDAESLREALSPGTRLVVVGAGFLGAETAAAAVGLGCEVTMIEPAPAPLAAVGGGLGDLLTRTHREHGVDLRTGIGVSEVLPDGVRLADGTIVAADEVLVAIGSSPATDWLEASGLRLEDGVVCDELCRAAPGIYAAGDVARWTNPRFGTSMRIEHRTNAGEQGLAAARNLLAELAGEPGTPFAPLPYFWSDQYDLKISAYGYLRGHDETVVVHGDPAETGSLTAYRKDDRLCGVLGVGVNHKVLRPWRQALMSRTTWADALAQSSPNTQTKQESVR